MSSLVFFVTLLLRQEAEAAAALDLLPPTALEEALKIVSEIEAGEATCADAEAKKSTNPKRAQPNPKYLGAKSAAALASSNPKELLAGLKSEIPAELWAKMMELQSD